MTTIPRRSDHVALPDAGPGLARLAGAVGLVGPASAVSLGAFFAAGGPFGALNDVGNAVLGVLAGSLAVGCHRAGASGGTSGAVGTAAAVTGAGLTVAGTALVMSETTGYYLAGLVSATGFGLIGSWLAQTSLRSGPLALPPNLRTLGAAAGSVMALGLVSVPGVLDGVDDMEAAPVWLVASGIAWLGTYVLMPAWALRFRRGLRGR